MSQTAYSCSILGQEVLLIQCAELLQARGHRITSVVSANPKITRWAAEQGIIIVDPDSHVVAALREQNLDYFFAIANLLPLPEGIESVARLGAINLHDGPLPDYAGLYTPNWAILNHAPTHAITWHELGPQVYDGAILKQKFFPISPDETAYTINARCYDAALETFAELADELSIGQLQRSPQDLSRQRYFDRYERPRVTAALSWHEDAEKIEAEVRALDFGVYANPMGLPKLLINGRAYLVTKVALTGQHSAAERGEIVAISEGGLRIATPTHDLEIQKLHTIDGRAIAPADFAREQGLRIGSVLPEPDIQLVGNLLERNAYLAPHEIYWRSRLTDLEVAEIPYAAHSAGSGGAPSFQIAAQSLEQPVAPDFATAVFAVYLARLTGSRSFDLSLRDASVSEAVGGYEAIFAGQAPVRIAIDPALTLDAAIQTVIGQITEARSHLSYIRDLPARFPELAPLRDRTLLLPVAVDQTAPAEGEAGRSQGQLILQIAPDGQQLQWLSDEDIYDREAVGVMQRQFAEFMNYALNQPDLRVQDIPLLSEAEYRRIVYEWNATDQDYPDACIHELFEQQVERSPDEIAVIYEKESLSYRELNQRANQLAHYLRRLNVGPETLVGIYIEPSIELMVGIYAIHKAGAAYLPLDPTYPRDRLNFMVEDTETPVILTMERFVPELPKHQARVVLMDREWGSISRESDQNPQSRVRPDNLCYVLYTSGSTGKPKGVMIEHRNVINFYVGMDQDLQYRGEPGSLLAVTSLSFDISVLELFWTLSHGFKVVLYNDKPKNITPGGNGNGSGLHALAQVRQIEFSLFYFPAAKVEDQAAQYRLLIEGAKFADRSGFSAVWTPERHFHAFGGLYPNPSVTSAAIAACTEHIQIRAGSCVVPLHHPLRVAEEWSFVDNISKGRVGISIASGWQPYDFVLQPQNFAERKDLMLEQAEIIKRLWRGESVAFPGPFGKDMEVSILPRPVQKQLPMWLTAANNIETFRAAGAGGYNLLTHLLGQSLEEVGEKIAAYRQAWQEAGHAGRGHVTMMLHTLIGEDVDTVREIARQPMKDYLRSSVELTKKAAWNSPAFRSKAAEMGKNPLEMLENMEVNEEDMEAILDHAFERYFETSGLFGTPALGLKMVESLKEIDVDEIACLIDYGVNPDVVLAHLEHLNKLRELAQSVPEDMSEEPPFSMPIQMGRHGVDYLQCTPSRARLLSQLPGGHTALKNIKKMMVGGEAFPPALAKELYQLVGGDVLNMYGPTETTIWSTTHQLDGDIGSGVPIGRPIANTTIYILDSHMQPVPAGVPGELVIGGDGVARGYLNRPELTAERFLPDPFRDKPGAKMYRTGDLARFRPDGVLEFLGRVDFQVKIRGYRIELGEIEARLTQHKAVREAVVMAREDTPGDKRLVAYIIPRQGTPFSSGDLRRHLIESLPDYMIPSAFVTLEAFPLTPNGKVNRRALPAPDNTNFAARESVYVAPRTQTEKQLTQIWQEVIGLERIGINDNFFDLGGHSLLAMALFVRVEKSFGKRMPLATLFRSPTIASLAELLDGADETRADAAARAGGAHRGQPLTLIEHSGSLWDPIVTIQPKGSKPPFFVVGGNLLLVANISHQWGNDQPFYGIQTESLPGEMLVNPDPRQISQFFVDAIRRIQPQGPYYLSGCYGSAMLTLQIAEHFESEGDEVGLLVAFNQLPLKRATPIVKRAARKLVRLVGDVGEALARRKERGENLEEGVQSGEDLPDGANYEIPETESLQEKLTDTWTHLSEYLRYQYWENSFRFYQNLGRPIPNHLRGGDYEEMVVQYLSRQYQAPRPYPKPLLLFLTPAWNQLSENTPRRGWGDYIDGEIFTEVVPGDPCSMFMEPNVYELSRKLKGYMDEAQGIRVS